jgi:helix-turn-helix protein
MSTGELRRAEVLGRVKSKALRLTDAVKILMLSYRQTKRLWKRYRGEGAKGLQHRSAGRGSNRAKPEEFRRKVLQLIRKKSEQTVHILQGVEIKRPSHIFVRASKDGDQVTNVRVGHHAVEIMEETFSL